MALGPRDDILCVQNDVGGHEGTRSKGEISSSHPFLCFITFQYRYYISGHACIRRGLSIRVRPF